MKGRATAAKEKEERTNREVRLFTGFVRALSASRDKVCDNSLLKCGGSAIDLIHVSGQSPVSDTKRQVNAQTILRLLRQVQERWTFVITNLDASLDTISR